MLIFGSCCFLPKAAFWRTLTEQMNQQSWIFLSKLIRKIRVSILLPLCVSIDEMLEAMALFGRHATVDEKNGNKESGGAALVAQFFVHRAPPILFFVVDVDDDVNLSCFGVNCCK